MGGGGGIPLLLSSEPMGNAQNSLNLLLFNIIRTVTHLLTNCRRWSRRFDTDDLVNRAMALLSMVGVIGMANGINASAGIGHFRTFALSYAFVRLLLVLKYLRAAWSARV